MRRQKGLEWRACDSFDEVLADTVIVLLEGFPNRPSMLGEA